LWLESRCVRTREVARVGRLVASVPALILFASLFLTWGGNGRANFLVVFGALDRIGGSFKTPPSENAWQAYWVVALALAVLAALIVVAVFVDRPRVELLAVFTAVLGLGFAIDQIADPPQTALALPTTFVRSAPAGFPHELFGGAPGVGETLATVALVVAIGGFLVMLTSRHGVVRRAQARAPVRNP
jgi:hypothetical protein